MTNAEEMLESILNDFEAQNKATSIWMKDNNTHNKGYVMHDDGSGAQVFIVTVQEGKIEPTA